MMKLKEIRLANKLSQSQLAKKSEVSIRAIQKYEQQENINKEEFKLLDKIIDEIANEMISTL